MTQEVKVVFGGDPVTEGRAFGDLKVLDEAFEILNKNGCTTIDTAQLYGQSESILGKAHAIKRFTIDTKTRGGFAPGKNGASRENILSEAKDSRAKLGGEVDIFYIHAPDPNTPLDETLAAVNEVYKSGFFKRFGLSNYRAEDVQKVYDNCKEKGYVLPSVYQGNYSAVARRLEDVLFPTLRKLGFSFYAYSPLAGGFLVKTKAQIEEGVGRFARDTSLGRMYQDLYSKPALLEALDDWAKIAEEEGCTRAELAYRWVRYNSILKGELGDALIVGASSLDQLRQTFASISSGPLSEKAAKRIDEIWKKVKTDAPLDNYHRHDV